MSGVPGQPRGALGVVVDGAPLPEKEARALWQTFSEYMEGHKGDLAGFAKSQGFLSVHPRSEAGRALLVFSRTEAQAEYGAAPAPVRPVRR